MPKLLTHLTAVALGAATLLFAPVILTTAPSQAAAPAAGTYQVGDMPWLASADGWGRPSATFPTVSRPQATAGR